MQTNKGGQITIDTLAACRTRLNAAKAQYRMAQAKSEEVKILAYNLEDIVKAKTENSPVIRYSLTNADSTEKDRKWEIVTKPLLLKLAAVCTGLLSIFSFLGVICSMSGVANATSVYYLVVHRDGATVAGITFFILVTLGYTTYITFWGLFQLRFAGMMELVPFRTTPQSLSFNVRMIARLAAPLAFFYLGWIAENGIKSGKWEYNDAPTTYQTVTRLYNSSFFNVTTNISTHDEYYYNATVIDNNSSIYMPSSFSNFYQLQSVPAIKQSFGTIFPVILFILMALFVTNAFNYFWVLIKMPNMQFGAEIITEEQLREGKRQLLRHKKQTERAYRRQGLKNVIAGIAKNDEGGFIAMVFGWFGGTEESKSSSSSFAQSNADAERPTIKEPPALSGSVERKGAATLGISGGWKEWYGEVRSPGYLHLCKDRRAADTARNNGDPSRNPDPSALVIDLRLVMDFGIPDKKTKDNLELDLQLSDDTIRLKFKTVSEAEMWKRTLMEWKDFNIDYASIYPNGITPADMERGSLSGAASFASVGNSQGGVAMRSPVANNASASSAAAMRPSTGDDLDAVQVRGCCSVSSSSMRYHHYSFAVSCIF